jgi:hypothetical protein
MPRTEPESVLAVAVEFDFNQHIKNMGLNQVRYTDDARNLGVSLQAL